MSKKKHRTGGNKRGKVLGGKFPQFQSGVDSQRDLYQNALKKKKEEAKKKLDNSW